MFLRQSKRLPINGEHLEQQKVFSWLSRLNHPAAKLTYAIPNSALDTKVKRIYYAQEGAKSGVPDLHMAWPVMHGDGICSPGLWIEMKFGNNEPTENQIDWLTRLTEAGFTCYVCYSAEDAIKAIRTYLGL